MFKHLRVALASIFLVFATTIPVQGHTTSPSHYAANCVTGNTAYNAFAYIYRPFPSGSGSYKGVRASVTVQNLYPCANPTFVPTGNTYGGWSLVNVVNGARWVSGALTQFVQFGFAEQSCTIECQDGFINGITDWWYTADDNGLPFGVIHKGDWVDFDNDGDHDAYDRPHVGERYELTISWITTPCTCWRYRIFNEVGQTDYKDEPRTTSGYLTNVEYGFEIWNDASAFGHRDPDASFDMWPLQYLNSSGSIYTTLTDDVMPCEWQVQGGYPAPNHWGSEHCDITTPNGQTHIDGWQAWHN